MPPSEKYFMRVIQTSANHLSGSTIYFDDLTRTDTSSVWGFHARFISGQPQMHPVLDSLAMLLRDAWNHFPPSCANLVVSSTLDFITSLIIDHDQQKMLVWAWVICIRNCQILLVLGEQIRYWLSALGPNNDGWRNCVHDFHISTWHSIGDVHSDHPHHGQLHQWCKVSGVFCRWSVFWLTDL